VTFGGLTAVDELSLTMQSGELVSLIGPNGAGKTTVFNAITGVYPLAHGAIRLGDTVLSGLPPHRVAGLGVGRTFQNIRLFKGLTVLDNLRAAMHHASEYGLLRAAFRSRGWAATEARLEAEARELLGMFGLAARADEPAGSLPYGEQRRLEIVRALALGPRLLLLDEPAAGMNPAETQHLMELIRSLILRFSLAILLIEHDMRLVMGVSDRVVVLNYGREIAVGTPDEIAHDLAVIEAYLGEPTH
jgi:branched-chain amino acid transport system ATP-binding protein